MVCQRTIKNSESLWHSINLNFYEVCLIIGLNHFEPEMIRNGLIFEKHGGAGPSNGIHWMRLNFRGMISGFDIININSIILGMFILGKSRIFEENSGSSRWVVFYAWWNRLEPIPPGSWRVQKRRAPRSPHSTTMCRVPCEIESHQQPRGSSLGMEEFKGCTPSHGQTLVHPTWPSKCPSHYSHATRKSLENMTYKLTTTVKGQLLCLFSMRFRTEFAPAMRSLPLRPDAVLREVPYPESHCPYINISHH